MSMSILSYDTSDSFYSTESITGSSSSTRTSDGLSLHISDRKFQIPAFHGLIDRPRIDVLLSKSVQNFPVTLVCGRSGTGKTALASAFASSRSDVAWYSVEPPDVDWRSFAGCALASVKGKDALTAKNRKAIERAGRSNAETMCIFLDTLFDPKRPLPSLFVIDNVHYVFESEWLRELFDQVAASVPESTSILMLSRSKPPNPLWRLRSKQLLNVIDERILAFNEREAIQLFRTSGLSRSAALDAHRKCFGNVSSLANSAHRSK